nr:aminodeoxychorismate synthase component I [Desulfobulbaceae bacterium]
MKPPALNEQTLHQILSFVDSKSDCIFLETSKTNDENFCSYIFYDPVEILSFHKDQPLEEFFKQVQNCIDQGLYLAGWVSYEFGYALEPVLQKHLGDLDNRPLLKLGVFKEPIIFDHRNASFSKPFKHTLPCPDTPGSFSINNVRPSMSMEEYLKNLDVIKEYIEAGDTYQVNYTMKLLFDFAGSPTALYKMLRFNQPVSYGAFLKLAGRTTLSFSPELFFTKTADTCLVRPMKGTIARGLTWAEDQKNIHTLQNDIKNRSENIMIVDLLRNDLGRLSEKGSVSMSSMFDVETYATLHQMTSTVTGRLKPEINLTQIFKAFFPCGSVTGAPKIRTMEIIHELEKLPRGIYTGGIGFIGPESVTFNVPIRTLVLNQGQSEMGIGSGIVHDSNNEDEWRECLLKAKFLTSPCPDFQLIETVLWTEAAGFYLLDRHLSRLKKSAEYFDFPFDGQRITKTLSAHKATKNINNKNPAKVRLLLHRDGTLEISSNPCAPPDRLKFQDQPATDKKKLPKIRIST